MLIWITIWLDWCELWLARREDRVPAAIPPPPPPRGAKVTNLAEWKCRGRAA